IAHVAATAAHLHVEETKRREGAFEYSLLAATQPYRVAENCLDADAWRAREGGLARNPWGSAIAAKQADLMREAFGNPRAASAFGRAWGTADVLSVEAGSYQEKAFERTPILADALEDAGCADRALLGHLRGPGPHARGCWVVDVVLGKQ